MPFSILCKVSIILSGWLTAKPVNSSFIRQQAAKYSLFVANALPY